MTRKEWNDEYFMACLDEGINAQKAGGQLPWHYYLPGPADYCRTRLDEQVEAHIMRLLRAMVKEG